MEASVEASGEAWAARKALFETNVSQEEAGGDGWPDASSVVDLARAFGKVQLRVVWNFVCSCRCLGVCCACFVASEKSGVWEKHSRHMCTCFRPSSQQIECGVVCILCLPSAMTACPNQSVTSEFKCA